MTASIIRFLCYSPRESIVLCASENVDLTNCIIIFGLTLYFDQCESDYNRESITSTFIKLQFSSEARKFVCDMNGQEYFFSRKENI